jgi:hypothetical protein
MSGTFIPRLSPRPNLEIKLTFQALWYFPVLMINCGIAMVVFDSRIIHSAIRKIRNAIHGPHPPAIPVEAELGIPLDEQNTQQIDSSSTNAASTASGVNPLHVHHGGGTQDPEGSPTISSDASPSITIKFPYSIVIGSVILGLFVIFFIVIMVLRGTLTSASILFRFFANILLAGNKPKYLFNAPLNI